MTQISEIYNSSNAWPITEAKAILSRLGGTTPTKGYILFETGYGPSGLPHIGTFGEVVRTTMVRRALEAISGLPTKLLCVSDDMDGMRKIPDNIPNPEAYKQYIGLPLTKIPDPFGKEESFAHNMNQRLRNFLDSFGFEYEFMSASESYRNGVFNQGILAVMRHHQAIMDIMLPTLGPERRSTYSPFMPVCPKTGQVLQVPITGFDPQAATISYLDPIDRTEVTISALNGGCKLQWKVDFGMRWALLGVDFEMYGKDHLVNGKIYSAICQALGSLPPRQMFYELFLDYTGQKISKSKGNGLTIEEWLSYAPQESLSLFMYVTPQKAKKLHPEVIGKNVDEYLAHWRNYHSLSPAEQLSNPLYHIHGGVVPEFPEFLRDITYGLLVNLAVVCNTQDPEIILQYAQQHQRCHSNQLASATATAAPTPQPIEHFFATMVRGAINYCDRYIRPQQRFRPPTPTELPSLHSLLTHLRSLVAAEQDATTLQNLLYTIAREHGIDGREWFQSLYEVTLGQSTGPRLGSFIHIYGIGQFAALLADKLGE